MNQTTRFSIEPGCKQLFAWIATVSLSLLPCLVRADIVTDWNNRALATMAAERLGANTSQARTLAMMHIAMSDAVNAAGKRYTPYSTAMPDAAGASPEAAVHAAARQVLGELYPKQKASLDAAFDGAMAKLPEGTAKSGGIAAGERSAAAVLAARKADGLQSPETYRPVTSPGVYITTSLPIMSHVASVSPFALKSVSQFRPGPPPALNSTLWARDYNETKELGGTNSAKRTAWQAETGRFWQLGGVPAWNEAARALLAGKPLPLHESARLFAHLNIAIFDAYLAIFDAKYQYGFWRPVTAIRNGDHDGNDVTARDAGWTPLITTPLHPEYPCAHCVVDGAAGVVAKSVFGNGTVPEFTVTFAEMPGVMRKYTSIQQLEDEVSMARIWGGVHYRNSNEVGHALGKQVGEYVLSSQLRPAP